MSKFYNPRDYDVIGIGRNRRYVRITDEELHKRFVAAEKKRKKKKRENDY